jgi:hypothetical protein
VIELLEIASVLAPLTTWESVVVALVGAALWALPVRHEWKRWQRSVGLLLVTVVARASAALVGEVHGVVHGAAQGLTGLAVSWLLVKIVGRAGDRVLARVPATNKTDEP